MQKDIRIMINFLTPLRNNDLTNEWICYSDALTSERTSE